MSEPIQFDFAAANAAHVEVKLQTGRRLTEEDVRILGDFFTRQLEQYILDAGLGDIHAAFVISHATEPNPDENAPGLLAIQNGVIDIYGRSALKGTRPGDILGGATVQCALQWAGQFLNHEEVVQVTETEIENHESEPKVKAEQEVTSVTAEHLESIIVKEDFFVIPDTTVTICMLTLKNGFSVRGESACVDPNNFKKEVGETVARKDAFSKLWQLEGYLLKQRLFENPAQK